MNDFDDMIDLETMGTARFSPVVAIAAVRFKADDITSLSLDRRDVFYQKITLESCLDVGLKPSASTIEWWLTDPSVTQQAREATFTGDDRVKLPVALDAFTDWLNSAPDTLWGNSAAFDLGLLADCYKVCGKEVPWIFYQEACYRTLKNLPAVRHLKMQRLGIHHDARDDALSQAFHLCQIVQQLGAYTLQPTESN